MSEFNSFMDELSESEIADIRGTSETIRYKSGESIFVEGDLVDSFYIIESGKVSIFVDKCGKDEPICSLSKGDYFGEMAIFNKGRRVASAIALEATELLSIDKDLFLEFVKSHPVLAEKINKILDRRNEELFLIESVVGNTGVKGERFHVSIKGDPSLRESAFVRERYESVVDKILPDLIPVLEDIILNRCVYQLFINFNSGEIRTNSIFDPFHEEIHTANKFISPAYVERHFPLINYQQKTSYIQRLYSCINNDELTTTLPEHIVNAYKQSTTNWNSVEEDEIRRVIGELKNLRNIQSFYLRNFGISMTRDAIRMQFNCDGTHFVSSEDYHRFLEENLE